MAGIAGDGLQLRTEYVVEFLHHLRPITQQLDQSNVCQKEISSIFT